MSASRFTNYFGTEPEHISHFRRMMTEIANSVNYFHVEFECSGIGGGCADADAKRRSVKAAFPNFIIHSPAKD